MVAIIGRRETSTMPGYAGSSWYFLRFMDPHNEASFADRSVTDYWREVDVYIGGTEHAVGHLLYSRMWTKALYDLGYISFEEPFKKLINQGMIQGNSYYVDILNYTWNYPESSNPTGRFKLVDENRPVLVSYNLSKEISPDDKKLGPRMRGEDVVYSNSGQSRSVRMPYIGRYVDSRGRLYKQKFVEYCISEGAGIYHDVLDIKWLRDENGEQYLQLKHEVEKMSKSKYNVVNPDDIVAQYGADTFRMYEMFLGPLDVSKPWDTKGIEGVHRFLKKLWRLFYDEQRGLILTDEAPTDAEWRILHKTIKKIGEDIEKFSFNTAVSQFMICVNDLTAAQCHKRAILEPLTIVLAPFAPHMAEELWQQALGQTDSVTFADFPAYEQRYVVDNTKLYPIAVNGKTRLEIEFPMNATQAEIEVVVLADATIQKWLDGKKPKKIIFVQGRMINIVI